MGMNVYEKRALKAKEKKDVKGQKQKHKDSNEGKPEGKGKK